MAMRVESPARGTPLSARFEALSDRMHARFGSRSLMAFVASMWSIGLPMVVAGPFVFHDFAHLSMAATLSLLLKFGATWFVCVCDVVLVVGLLSRPLRRFERDADAASAVTAWRAVARLPIRFALWAVPAALVPGVVGGLWSVATVVRVQLPLLVLGGIATAAGTFAMVVAATVALPVLTRPVLRALAPFVEDGERPAGVSLKRLLPIMLPTISIVAAVAGASFSLQRGDQTATAYLHLGMAATVAAVISVPASLIVAHLLIEPVRELVASAERIADGDFTEPIGAQTTHEFGILADALNHAMAGLAERRFIESDNARLAREVRASRARIVTAGYEARRKVGRDLHDGAQPRLLAVAVRLRLLEEEALGLGVNELARELERCIHDVRAVVGEVRELARGVHPTVLATNGLRAAFENLAGISPVPVQISVSGERYPEAVELTVYFLVAEALANAIKHADASRIEVLVDVDGTHLCVAVTDDGCGGAQLLAGSGLSGINDRVAALGGDLHVDSPPGRGTMLTCRLPIAPDVDGSVA